MRLTRIAFIDSEKVEKFREMGMPMLCKAENHQRSLFYRNKGGSSFAKQQGYAGKRDIAPSLRSSVVAVTL